MRHQTTVLLLALGLVSFTVLMIAAAPVVLAHGNGEPSDNHGAEDHGLGQGHCTDEKGQDDVKNPHCVGLDG